MLPLSKGNQTQNSFGNLGNLFKNALGSVKNFLSQGAPQQYNNEFVPASNIPEYYQVKGSDSDMSTVAANLNLPLNNLVNANQGIKTLPPKGSYIQLPTAQQPTGLQQYQASERGTTLPAPTGGSFFSGSGQVNLTELNANVQQQVAQGTLPSTVSYYTPIINPATGQPATQAEMMANGYVYDNFKKEWKLAAVNTPAAQASPQPQLDPYSQIKSVYYSKSKGYVTPEVADLKNRRRQARSDYGEWLRSQQVPVAAPSDNAGATAGTVLDLHLGSG